MDMFVLGAIAVLAAMAGFWAGRSVQWQLVEAAEAEVEDNRETAVNPGERPMGGSLAGGRPTGRRLAGRAENRRQSKTLSLGREIGSPVAGQVSVFEENGRCKVRILPDQGKVYAPTSGKIRRLYPMGSAMLLQTEFGADILLRAGSHVDEMCSDYYHCRVMEHEYVRKGTLLLEYDPAGISREGAEPEIVLSVENEEELGGMSVTGQGRIKAGEPVLYVACGKHSESYEKLP